MDDDDKFRQMLRGLNKTFYHQTVTAEDVEQFICKAAHRDLRKMFTQYLYTAQIPVFTYALEKNKLKYRWSNCIAGFDMPVKIIAGKTLWLYPTDKWKSVTLTTNSFVVDPNFYVGSTKK
jgi:aminopeptidase N